MPEEKKEKKPAAAPPSGILKPKGKKKKLSVLKRARQDKKKSGRNYSAKSTLKSLLKKVNTAIMAKDKDKAKELFHLLTSTIDRAARKRIIHKNKAARHKSILARRLHALLTA